MKILADVIKEAHPVYYVAELERSIVFYREALGLEMAWQFGETIVGFRLTQGFLIVLCEDPARVRSKETPPLVISVREIDKVYQTLRRRGVQFREEPVDSSYGRIASFTDPDGYAFDLCG